MGLRSDLAEYAHDAWASWMQHLLGLSTKNPDGTVTIPAESIERWTRQMNTPYRLLPEDEKRPDREEAAKIVDIVNVYR